PMAIFSDTCLKSNSNIVVGSKHKATLINEFKKWLTADNDKFRRTCTFVAMDFSLELVEERVKPHQVTSLHLIAALMLLGAGGLAFLIRLKAPAMPIPGFMVVSAATWCILTG